MSFTFDPELGDSISKVRVLLGDTTSPGKASDEQIEMALDGEGQNVYEAGATVAEQLAAKYAGEATSRSIGEMSISASNLQLNFEGLALTLRNHRRRNGVPIGFGWSRSEKEEEESDLDREPIISKKGGMDHHGTDEGA